MVLQYIKIMRIMNLRFIKNLFFLLFSSVLLIKADNTNNNELALHHFMQGEFLMNQGNYALAVLEFQDAIALDPNAATIHVSLADGYRRLGKQNRSENHLRIALELDPNEIEALEMLGQLLIIQKKYVEAQNVYIDLNQADSENLDFIFTLADLARLQSNWDLAINYYMQGYEVNPLAINGLEQALQIALTTSKFKRAEEICELLLIDNPDNIDLLQTMKDLTLFNRNFDKSLEILNELERLNGISSDILIQKSALYDELGKKDLALETMFLALDNDGQNIEILHRLVTVLMDQEKNQEAIFYNQKIIEYHPNDPRGFINNAIMAMSGKKPEEAINALSPYSNKFSQDFTVQYLLGTAYYQVKDFDNSKLYLSRALKIYPESRNTKHNLALIYDSMGEWSESDKLYTNLIATDSTDAQAYNNYAYSLAQRNQDIEFALELAQNAIMLEPKSAPYLDTIGWIYFKMNYYDKALDYIRESLSIDSDNITIQEHFNEIIKVKSAVKTQNLQRVENQD